MVLRGLAVGCVGEKKNRNAVGPSDGKMNGVRVTIASRARLPIVTKPFMNIKAAHTCLSWNRPSRVPSWNRSMIPLLTSGSNTCNGFLSFGPDVVLFITFSPFPDAAVQSNDQAQKPGVEDQQDCGRDRGWGKDCGLSSEQGIQCGGNQPQLYDHDDPDQQRN